ncbi:MAG: metallophosphoesterase [Myxococcales bacterium]|nr:metallophosphoesterase [Myxococcales bacterium]
MLRFLAIFGGMVAGAHGYFLVRLVYEPHLPAGTTHALTALVTGLGALLFALPFVTRLWSPARTRPVALVGYAWMGMAFYLLLGLWASDLLLWVTRLSGLEVARNRAALVFGLAAVACAAGMFTALRTPAVRRLEVRLPRWPERLSGFRIVQLSDIHIGALLQRRFAQAIVDRCNALEPDLVAITGDVVDGRVQHLRPHVAPFAALRSRHGVVGVPGNHDHYAGARAWLTHFEELGMRMLSNEHIVIETHDAAVVVGGADDRSASHAGDDVAGTFAAAPAGPRILLAHHPQTFEQADTHRVALQLSGHTHGGQMWPFVYFVPLQTRFVAGLYRDGEAALYVSRGTGFWGPPMRLFAPAEITELVLMAATSGEPK